MEKKKLKLTISGSSKKTINNIELAKSKSKNAVVIEKKNNRFGSKSSFSKNIHQRNTFSKPKTNFIPKEPIIKKSSTNDFEKRKLAEQRATKRLKGENVQKGKIGSKKRELKLTVSRALSENELNGEFRISGKYFNYPDCCINSYPAISSSQDKWANSLIENSGPGPYPCWSNRLATGWGGACFSGELFPCSLHCQNAIAIGRKTYNCLLDIGFKKLSREFLQQSLNPLIVHKNGAIEKVLDSQKYKKNIINFFK